jgi:hypothetical protein
MSLFSLYYYSTFITHTYQERTKQPTMKELMAMIAFFIGYLYRAIYEERQLRPPPSVYNCIQIM